MLHTHATTDPHRTGPLATIGHTLTQAAKAARQHSEALRLSTTTRPPTAANRAQRTAVTASQTATH